MIIIKNYEAIIRRPVGSEGWYVLGIKRGYKKYYINITKTGEMLFKTCELNRVPNEDGNYILKCGNEYCWFTKEQLGDMNYILDCLETLTLIA